MAGNLDGVRVLDLSGKAGHLAGKLLAELGADVIKLEPPGGDAAGRRGPYLGDVEDPERSLPWLALNTSKRGITLDLAAPRGQSLFRALAARADVVLETFAPGTMEGWELGYESLARENPRLVYAAITPFGRTGPYASFRGGDVVVVAMGGNAYLTGDPDRPPLRCSLPTSIFHACADAAVGVAMALYARERSGRGQVVDVSMQECQLPTLVTGPGQYALSKKARHRTGRNLGNTREIWEARDGHVSFGLRSGQARIPNLVATVEYMAEEGMAPEWLRKYDWASYNHNTVSREEIARLEEAFGAFFVTKTRRDLYEQALVRRIMLAPCNDAREILDQPQLRDREFFTRIEYPEYGAEIEHPAFFGKSSATEIGVRGRAPGIGEHNAQVFAELGLDEGGLCALRDEGIV